LEPPAIKNIVARALCVSQSAMTDARPRRRLAPFGVAARVPALFAIMRTLLRLSCLTLTGTSHCIALANIAIDVVKGRPSFSENLQMRTNPLWCALWRYAFLGTPESDGQPVRCHVTRDCCPVFRHWRDLASTSLIEHLYIQQLALDP
jgi:hypothetical protein